MQGVMDQIAGFIVRDPKLVEQGKHEWRKAAAMRRAKKRRAARGETTKGTSTPKGSGTRTPNRKIPAAKGKATAATGFLASLFGKKKTVTRSASTGAVRRALTKPGQNRTSACYAELPDSVD